MSDSNLAQLAYIEETAYNAAVTGSALQILRHTGESLHLETQTKESSEIRSDRQVSAMKRTGVNAAGGVNYELSYGAYDDLIAAALMSAGWSTLKTKTATTISAVAADNSINDSAEGFVTAGFLQNQWVKVSGFTTAANNGYFKIVSVAVGKIVLAGGTLVNKDAGDSVTVNMGQQVTNGTTLTSYNIEKEFADIASTFHLLTGMAVDQLSLNIATNDIITGSMSFVGANETPTTATTGTGDPTTTTAEVMSSVDDVESIIEGGAAHDCTGFSFQLQNNLRTRMKVGNLGAISLGVGKCQVSGTFKAYFESNALITKYLNFTDSSLAVVVVDTDGNAYIFDFPRVKYTSDPPAIGGSDQDVMDDMAFTATVEPTEDITIRIVKFPAA